MLNLRLFSIMLLVPFSLLTLYAITQVGYLGILDYHRHSPAGWQVMADLVVALLLVLAWLVPNARAHGRNPWPWIAITLTMGSIGPLLYLALSPKARESQPNREPLAE